MQHWPACGSNGFDRCWNNVQYLSRSAGCRTVSNACAIVAAPSACYCCVCCGLPPCQVSIEVGADYMASDWGQRLMTFDAFLALYMVKGRAAAGTAPPLTGEGPQVEAVAKRRKLALPPPQHSEEQAEDQRCRYSQPGPTWAWYRWCSGEGAGGRPGPWLFSAVSILRPGRSPSKRYIHA